MYCEAGHVKIRLAARAVPDLDPGPLVSSPRQQPPSGSPLASPEQTVPQGLPSYGVYNVAGIDS